MNIWNGIDAMMVGNGNGNDLNWLKTCVEWNPMHLATQFHNEMTLFFFSLKKKTKYLKDWSELKKYGWEWYNQVD